MTNEEVQAEYAPMHRKGPNNTKKIPMETTKKVNLKLQFSKHLIEDNVTLERYADLDFTSICGYCK